MRLKNKDVESYLSSTGKAAGRVGLTKEELKNSFLENLFYGIGRLPILANRNDLYRALALAIRDRVFRESIKAIEGFAEQDVRAVAYLSAEYLPGPHLGNNLLYLNITEQTREALKELELKLEDLLEQEEEPGLGNGGLGRLASCYMDAMATLGVPAIGYGIRYEFGIFKQNFQNGWQTEATDKWLHYGNPWEIQRPEVAYEVKFGGRTEHGHDTQQKYQVKWIPDSMVKGTAYDTPILGYQSKANILRLWSAEAVESFDFSAFNLGDYYRAVEAKLNSENITKVLYPNDETISGKELRLKQQYFFVSCSLQDMIFLHLLQGRSIESFHEKFAIQLNDTHPSIAVAELMRLLVDEHQLEWTAAWNSTQNTFAYTNHTLLPEALEKWSVKLLGKLLPRHLEIIYEINRRFVEQLRQEGSYSEEKIGRMSIIDESGEGSVRMANLATLGSSRVNGVSALHSGLLKEKVLNDFADLWPEKFVNVTNGIAHRRFLGVGNPELSALITEKIGKEWLTDLNALQGLREFADDEAFQDQWTQVKLRNKQAFSDYMELQYGIKIDPTMLFDVQAKRLHEYKRQHLKVLHILQLYLRLKKGKGEGIVPTAFIFAGKAAPGYFMAKRIIKLINAVGELVNNDPETREILKVVFLPNFNVKQAQRLYPAADLSEQISLAGMEASGTGNMKLALNGALTVGTLDGANVEIREEVGEENFFLFGLSTEEVEVAKATGYQPQQILESNPELREVLDFLLSEELTQGDRELFRPIYDNLYHQDPYLLLKDYQSYIDCQDSIHELWRDSLEWARKSILNVAGMGKFSGDRSIKEYCEEIWGVDVKK